MTFFIIFLIALFTFYWGAKEARKIYLREYEGMQIIRSSLGVMFLLTISYYSFAALFNLGEKNSEGTDIDEAIEAASNYDYAVSDYVVFGDYELPENAFEYAGFLFGEVPKELISYSTRDSYFIYGWPKLINCPKQTDSIYSGSAVGYIRQEYTLTFDFENKTLKRAFDTVTHVSDKLEPSKEEPSFLTDEQWRYDERRGKEVQKADAISFARYVKKENLANNLEADTKFEIRILGLASSYKCLITESSIKN